MAWGDGGSPSRRRGERGAIIAILLSLLQWFLGAPSLRYGGLWFWFLAAVLLAPLLTAAMRDAHQRTLVFVGALAFCFWAGAFALRVDLRVPKLWGRPPYPATVELKRIDLESTSIALPTAGDQCWDEALPCAPMLLTRGLRSSDDLGAGFLPP